MRTCYRIDDFQETVLGNLEDLLNLARIDFGPVYERVRDGRDFAAKEVLLTDLSLPRTPFAPQSPLLPD